MKSILVSLFILINVFQLAAQDYTRYDSFEDFEKILHIDNDTTYVVNFWATWCGPCVKELPYFEQLHEKYKNEKVKVVLVSLDFKKQIERKFIPFLNKHKIQSEVVLLFDSNETEWIEKVDPTWSGSIPITLVYRGTQRQFIEDDFHSFEELEQFVFNIYKN